MVLTPDSDNQHRRWLLPRSKDICEERFCASGILGGACAVPPCSQFMLQLVILPTTTTNSLPEEEKKKEKGKKRKVVAGDQQNSA